MKIREILLTIVSVANDHGLSEPWLVGGTPRDKILNRLDQLSDLDITTGDDSVHTLARSLSQIFQGSNYHVGEDGHATIQYNGLKLDFSSNFRVPEIETILQRAGIANPTSMQCELFSRDFTCNALLMSLDLKTIKDPTGFGIADIKNKLIKTCLPASYTLGSQNRRVPRIFYLAAKLGFEVDQEIIDWVRKNPQSIANCKSKYLVEKITKAIQYDRKKTIELFDRMGVWHHLPPIPELINLMTKTPNRI